MKPHYTLIEVARKLELNQRAEVNDVLKQILNPDPDNPFLIVSVCFDDDKPARLITRGEFGKEDYRSLPAKGSAHATLPGFFDIHVLRHPPMEMILNGGEIPWPDEDGFYPLKSNRTKGFVVILVKDGIAYELRDIENRRESDLLISGENLKLYAEQRGIALIPNKSETPSEESGDREKEPYTQEEAAALVGREPGTILNLLTSRGPHSRPLTPCIFVAGKRASSVREGKEVVLNGFYSVEGIEYAPFDNEEYVFSFGGSSRLLLHKGQDTFLLRAEVRKKKKDLLVSVEEIDQWVAEIERDTPPIHTPPKNATKEYIEKRLAEGADKAEIAAELQERGITHWGLQAKNSPKQWLSQEEAAERMNISPEKLFEEGYLMSPLVYFIEPVQMSYIYSYRSEEKKGVWFDSVVEWHQGFFAIGNFHNLCPSLDGFYQIGNRKASLWLDPSDEEGSYVIEEAIEVHKSQLLVAERELEECLEERGRTGKVGLPESDHQQVKPPIRQSNQLDRERRRELPAKPLTPEECVNTRLKEGLSKEEIAIELRSNGKTYLEIARLLCSDGSYVTVDALKKRGERLVKNG